jgi:hypothetical protein
MGILTKIGGWLIGGGIASIGEQLNKAYQAKLAAQTDQAKMQADMDIAQLEARQAVLIAEQGSWLTSWIRPAFALPFVLFNAKVIVWDKMLGWGATDNLTPEFYQMEMMVMGAYFLGRSAEKVAQVVTRKAVVAEAAANVKSRLIRR